MKKQKEKPKINCQKCEYFRGVGYIGEDKTEKGHNPFSFVLYYCIKNATKESEFHSVFGKMKPYYTNYENCMTKNKNCNCLDYKYKKPFVPMVKDM